MESVLSAFKNYSVNLDFSLIWAGPIAYSMYVDSNYSTPVRFYSTFLFIWPL